MSSKYTAAVKTSALDTTSKSLAALSDVFKKDPKLPKILTAPTLTPNDKSQIVQELQRHTGEADKSDTVKNFLKTLADNNRLGILEGVCEKFTTLMGASRGEVDLTITSASVSQRRTVAKWNGLTMNAFEEIGYENSSASGDCSVQVRVQPRKEVESHSKGSRPAYPVLPQTNSLQQVDPDIKGGLIVEIGDRTIDLSVSSRIGKMNKLLTDSL